MRLHHLGLRGITEAFRDQVWVDFEGLGPGLIAIIGENGVGKSTLIGSAFAALFRQLPGQKRLLYDFCTHPQPEIDLAFSVNGEQYRSLLKLDPQARQMESYVFDSRGIALVNGKKEVFAEWISRHVGSSRLFLASLYSSQTRTGNFLGLERTQRKELKKLRKNSPSWRSFAGHVRAPCTISALYWRSRHSRRALVQRPTSTHIGPPCCRVSGRFRVSWNDALLNPSRNSGSTKNSSCRLASFLGFLGIMRMWRSVSTLRTEGSLRFMSQGGFLGSPSVMPRTRPTQRTPS